MLNFTTRPELLVGGNFLFIQNQVYNNPERYRLVCVKGTFFSPLQIQ